MVPASSVKPNSPSRRAFAACEKDRAVGTGPLRVPTAHNVASRAGNGLAALLVSLFVLVSVAACSADPDPARDDRDHIDGDRPNVIGRHIYDCAAGGRWAVDFLTDGLTVDLRPDGAQVTRLTAPAQGLTYVGDKITARISGQEMHIQRSEKPPLTCQRT